MMNQVMSAGLLILVSLGVTGCNNTLVFAEKSGYNLAINVNDDPSTPVHVNMGLERSIATVVPPRDVTQSDQGKTAASAEAVSLFSGFRLKYYNESELKTPFSATLAIRTQFASGMAARSISENPEMVGKVVDASFVFDREAADLEATRQARVNKILDSIDRLNDATAKSLAVHPPVNEDIVSKVVAARDPHNLRATNPAFARQILKMEVVLDKPNDTALAAWEAAVTAGQ